MSKKSYHHGNLREALINAALIILADDGVEGVSLRKVAQKAGVSATALYTHFKDKRELLAIMAAFGFDGLSASMLEPSKSDEKEADKALEMKQSKMGNNLLALAKGYVLFAIKNPSLFQLMFGKQFIKLDEFPALAEASSSSYAIMSNAVAKQVKASGGQVSPKIGAAAAWSMMHGLSTLINDGKITAESSGVSSIDELIKAIGGTLIFS